MTTNMIPASDLRVDDTLVMRGFPTKVTRVRFNTNTNTVWFETDRFPVDYLPMTAKVRVLKENH